MRVECPSHVPQPEQARIAEVVSRHARGMDASARDAFYECANWLLRGFEMPDAGDLLKAYAPTDGKPTAADLLRAIQEAEAAGLVKRIPQPEPEPYEAPKKRKKGKAAKKAEPQETDPQPGADGMPVFAWLPPAEAKTLELIRADTEKSTGYPVNHGQVLTTMIAALNGLLSAEAKRRGRSLMVDEALTLLNWWAAGNPPQESAS